MKYNKWKCVASLLGFGFLFGCGGTISEKIKEQTQIESSINTTKSCVLQSSSALIQSFRVMCANAGASDSALKRYYRGLRSLMSADERIEAEWIVFNTWSESIPGLKKQDLYCVQKILCRGSE